MKARKERLGHVSPQTKLIAVAAGLAFAVSGCGKDNSSVQDLVLSCKDKSKTPKSFAIVNLDDNTNIKGVRSHRTDMPFNTSQARDSFPEDRSLSAAAILYNCTPNANQTKQENKKGPAPPDSIQNPEFVAPHDRSITFSLGTSEPDTHIGTRSYVGGNIFDGDIPLGPNTEGILIYAVKDNGDEPNGNQAKLGINSVTGIYPDEIKFHSADISVNPPESHF